MSQATKVPQNWATSTNYSTGPDTGTPTKVDPSSSANGFLRGAVAAPQHVNFHFHASHAAVRRLLQIAALQLAPISNLTGDTPTDTSQSMAATAVDPALPTSRILLIKSDSDGVWRAFEDQLTGASAIASITSAVREAATNGSRIVAIGSGGNLNSYSDDGGETWSAGAAGIAGASQYLVYSPHYDGFLCGGSGTGSVSRSPNASTIWTSAASGFAAVQGLAVLGDASGTIVCLGNSGIEPRFSRSANDGSSFSAAGTVLPDAATAEEPGSLAGCPLVTRDGLSLAAYHVMRCNAGARLRVTSTTDGHNNWTRTATIEAPAGASFDQAPRLMICQMTGLMLIACRLDTGARALYASLDGSDWVGPSLLRPGPASHADLAVAGGRLFMARDTSFFASAGIGVA